MSLVKMNMNTRKNLRSTSFKKLSKNNYLDLLIFQILNRNLNNQRPTPTRIFLFLGLLTTFFIKSKSSKIRFTKLRI